MIYDAIKWGYRTTLYRIEREREREMTMEKITRRDNMRVFASVLLTGENTMTSTVCSVRGVCSMVKSSMVPFMRKKEGLGGGVPFIPVENIAHFVLFIHAFFPSIPNINMK